MGQNFTTTGINKGKSLLELLIDGLSASPSITKYYQVLTAKKSTAKKLLWQTSLKSRFYHCVDIGSRSWLVFKHGFIAWKLAIGSEGPDNAVWVQEVTAPVRMDILVVTNKFSQ
jgi:hypothetical protein